MIWEKLDGLGGRKDVETPFCTYSRSVPRPKGRGYLPFGKVKRLGFDKSGLPKEPPRHPRRVPPLLRKEGSFSDLLRKERSPTRNLTPPTSTPLADAAAGAPVL